MIVVIAVLGIIAAVLILKFYPGREEAPTRPERPKPERPKPQHPKRREAPPAPEDDEDYDDDDWAQWAVPAKPAKPTAPATPAKPAAPAEPAAPPRGGRFAAKQPTPEEDLLQNLADQPQDDVWDDLSDLGDLSIYLDDHDQ